MAKLTHYTNFQDLKKSQHSIHSKQSNNKAEMELKEFINLLTKHHISQKHSGIKKGSNQSPNGK
jgi:hypothetical protein